MSLENRQSMLKSVPGTNGLEIKVEDWVCRWLQHEFQEFEKSIQQSTFSKWLSDYI